MYQYIEGQLKIIHNPLQNDIFSPSNPLRYFSFSDFEILEKDIIFVDKNSPYLVNYLEDIISCDEIGIDTESIVAKTDFSKPLELLALIQIATDKKVYLLDPKNIDR